MPGAEGDLQKIAKEVDPATLSRCLLRDHGTLAPGGTGKVGGQPAVVIVDKGGGTRQVVIHFDGAISGLTALQLAGANPVTIGYGCPDVP